MRIALVDSTRKAKYYPIALLKIGAWIKSRGDSVALYDNKLPAPGACDEIWIHTVFTHDLIRAVQLGREALKRAPVVKAGGVAAPLLPAQFEAMGIPVHKGLIPEAEAMAPDYSLLPEPPTYSVVHTSRGCVRKCKFCMVPVLEPEFQIVEDWEKSIYPGAKKVLFYDNNWLAKPISILREDVRKILELKAAGAFQTIDFNQALDARLLSEAKADLLAQLPVSPVRFSYDAAKDKKAFELAVQRMIDRGAREIWYYVLYNFTDTPADFYERIRYQAEIREKNASINHVLAAIPLRYHPILEPNPMRDYCGPHWTPRKLKGFMIYLSRMSVGGQVSTHGGAIMSPVEEFEYWLGKDAVEFERLLAYPQARKLARVKKEKLRIFRLTARIKELAPAPQETAK